MTATGNDGAVAARLGCLGRPLRAQAERRGQLLQLRHRDDAGRRHHLPPQPRHDRARGRRRRAPRRRHRRRRQRDDLGHAHRHDRQHRADRDPRRPRRGRLGHADAHRDGGGRHRRASTFERRPAGGGSWTTIAVDATPGDGFSAAFATNPLPEGAYELRARARRRRRQPGHERHPHDPRRQRRCRPARSPRPRPATSSAARSVALPATAADTGSGVASVEFTVKPQGSPTYSTISTDSAAPTRPPGTRPP